MVTMQIGPVFSPSIYFLASSQKTNGSSQGGGGGRAPPALEFLEGHDDGSSRIPRPEDLQDANPSFSLRETHAVFMIVGQILMWALSNLTEK